MPIASINGIDLCYETFGDAANETLLLITGFGQQLTDWDEGLCQLFVDNGLYVIRFDNRDSGLSTHFHSFKTPDLQAGLAGDPSSAGYTLGDMAADCVGLLDHLGVVAAHVLGVSMGGMIAQIMAIDFPERVKSMVLLSTNSGHRDVGQPSSEIQAAPLPRPQGSDVISAAVESSGRWASWELGITPARLRARIQARVDRNYDPLASPRQLVAIVATPDRSDAIRNVNVPTVVIHGTDDPMVN